MINGIISNSKAELELINKKINDFMIEKISNYNAIQWGTIRKHLTKEKFVLIINEDSRNPKKILTNNDKLRIIELNQDDWFKKISMY